MSGEARVWTEPDLDVADSMVVVGMPTLGLVGNIASRYLVDALKMPFKGGVLGRRIPPAGRVEAGRAQFPISLHAKTTPCGLDGEARNLIVIGSELALDGPILADVAQAVAAWAVDAGAHLVVIPDAVGIEGVEDETIWSVASNDAAAEISEGLDLVPMDEGIVGGLSGALLFEGIERDLPVLCLLADSEVEHPDARAAARLVNVMDRLIPDILIGDDALLAEAERIEAHVRKVRSQMAEQERSTLKDSHHPSMYH